MDFSRYLTRTKASGRTPLIRITLCVAALLWCNPAVSAQIQERDASALKLASVHAAIVSLDSGKLLYEKDVERPVPVASITKLMTAMVVLDADPDMDEWLRIVEREHPPPIEAYSRLERGTVLQRKDLLRIMLMSSENLAAYVLAHHYPGGYKRFVDAMNKKSQAIGMHHTLWVNPSGLSAQNRATAADLVTMVRAAYDYETIREYTQTDYYTVVLFEPRRVLHFGNSNSLLHHDDWDIRLSKTGYLDAAGQCLAMVVALDGEKIIMVFLNAFGRLSPPGDMRRVAHWLRTNEGSTVARQARRYEQRKTRQFARADLIAASENTFVSMAALGRDIPDPYPRLSRLINRLHLAWATQTIPPYRRAACDYGNSLATPTRRCIQ